MKIHLGMNISGMFSMHNEFQGRHALTPLLFNNSLECAIKNDHENQAVLMRNGLMIFYSMPMMLLCWK
jgi:hypothetical protein